MAFDLQAHRGGVALTVENTLAAFTRALEVGVSTLEFDVQITADGRSVVCHDSVFHLTLAEVRALDVGSRRHPRYPEQRLVPGERMPLLTEVCDLLREREADGVRMNIELKVDAARPGRSAPPHRYVELVLGELRDAGMLDRASIQSFDWAALRLVRETEPTMPTYVLSREEYLERGRAGGSPWLGGLDVDDFAGSVQEQYVAAAASIGAAAVSPVHGSPYWGSVGDPDYQAFTGAELIGAAHDADLLVVPYTVNDRRLMEALIDLGVDGFITDRPDLGREVMAARGLALPARHPVRE